MRVLLEAATAVLLFAVALTDSHTMEIPDELNVLLGICAFVSVFVFPEIALMQRCVGAFCVSVPMALLNLAVREAFGGGDIKLSFVMGFALGWRACLAGFFLAVCIGGLQAVCLLLGGKVRLGEGAHMAFGPALCAGFFLAGWFGEALFEWYFSALL